MQAAQLAQATRSTQRLSIVHRDERFGQRARDREAIDRLGEAAVDRIVEGEETGFVYSRYGNPTVAAFEAAMAEAGTPVTLI